MLPLPQWRENEGRLIAFPQMQWIVNDGRTIAVLQWRKNG